MAGYMRASLAVRLLGCIQTNHLVPTSSSPRPPIPGRRDPKRGRRNNHRRSESKGDHMTAIAIAALIVFIAGIAAGIIVVVSIGIRREERGLASRREELDFPLTLTDPDGVTQGAR